MVSLITAAGAWSNGEVAYLAWRSASRIDGCLGFMITRVHETGADAGARRVLPTWIAFDTQSNPDWLAQDSSVWPIQSFEWRDLTLRRSRDSTSVRPIDFRVHYEIVPVGIAGPGRTLVPPSETAIYEDAKGRPRYEGKPVPLYMIGTPVTTNSIDVTHNYGGPESAVEVAFTNGILSTQNLLQQLNSIKQGAGGSQNPVPMPTSTAGLLAVLQAEIANRSSKIRSFLTADALSFVRRLLDRAITQGGEVYLALYELNDPELMALLETAAAKKCLHLILSTAGSANPNAKGTPTAERKPVLWDTENDPERARLHRIEPDPVQDRMFNNSTAIGHDKFAVYVQDGAPVSVMTGSTNFTMTGLCTQSNNAIIINDRSVAQIYLDFWHRLKADPQPERVPAKAVIGGKTVTGSAPNDANQGMALRDANQHPFGPVRLGDGRSQVQVWFSPNTATNKKTSDSPMPADLNDVYSLMDHAKRAILFLTFMPGESGRQNIIGEAAKRASDRPELLVLGAISDPRALPNYVRPAKGSKPSGPKIPSPSVWWPAGEESRVVMVRATAINTPYGDLHPELLSAGHAIIHDKIIVIDPMDAARCAVITGSHNLGYKASYDNDENMLIIRGNQSLALAYAVHVLDVYQHYLSRAKLEDQAREALLAGRKPPKQPVGKGFLQTKDDWQDRFFAVGPATSRDYFLGIAAERVAPAVPRGLGSRTSVAEVSTTVRKVVKRVKKKTVGKHK